MRFTSLRPSCDCLTAAVSKEAFAPGEMGGVRLEGLRVASSALPECADPFWSRAKAASSVNSPAQISAKPASCRS